MSINSGSNRFIIAILQNRSPKCLETNTTGMWGLMRHKGLILVDNNPNQSNPSKTLETKFNDPQ